MHALNLLPTDYGLSSGQVDPWYSDLDNFDYDKYGIVNDNFFDLRLSGKIVKGLKHVWHFLPLARRF